MTMKHSALFMALAMAFSPAAFSAASAHALPKPVTDADYYDNGKPSEAKVELGRLLYYDKITSGNKNISCGTCHHGHTATGDALSLGVGAGGRGLGVTRDTGSGEYIAKARIPRNAQPIFNLGAKSFTAMFHDGRVENDASLPYHFRSEAGDKLPPNLDNALAAQALFPVTVPNTMAGQKGQNPVANAADAKKWAGPGGVWDLLADRLRTNPEYVALFKKAFNIEASEITFVHAANAMAAFQAKAWRADNSPFDSYLRGDKSALSRGQLRGMRLFYGKANCASCHSGKFQTDSSFHAIAMPQIGPGKGVGYKGLEDFGREGATGSCRDRYKFRTPTLRNVALTGPWGHDGAFNSLEGVIRHHLDPAASLKNYNCKAQPVMPSRPDLDAVDCEVQNHAPSVMAIANANELKPMKLSKREVDDLMQFMHALTDPNSLDLRADVPQRVPSGLAVWE